VFLAKPLAVFTLTHDDALAVLVHQNDTRAKSKEKMDSVNCACPIQKERALSYCMAIRFVARMASIGHKFDGQWRQNFLASIQ
jgi:hypothetical protein